MSITRVQITGNFSNGNAVGALSSATISVSKAFASNNTLGNTIMVMVAGSCNAAAGLGISSPAVSDTQSNTYTQVGWLAGGTQSGGSIGLYMATNVHAGANTVTFSYTATCSAAVGGNFNAMVAIAEYSGMSSPAITGHGANQFFGGPGSIAQSLNVTTSTGTVTVNFSAPGTDSCIFAADFTVGAADYIIAGSRTLNSSQAVPTSTPETFTQAIAAGSGDFLYFWDSGTPVATTQPVRGNIDWDQTGLDTRQGSTYGTKFQYADGVFTSGNVPKFKSDGTLTDSGVSAGTAGGGGTVTSVALTMPSDFTVSGSPVTSSGAFAVTANTQAANLVKAGPSSGSAAAPTYRALVAADLPVATTGALGAVKPDGTTITILGGVISSSGGGSGVPFYLALSAPPSASTLTWFNQGTATATDLSNPSGLRLAVPASATTNLRGLVKSVSGNWSFTLAAILSAKSANFTSGGIVLRQSSTGKLITFHFADSAAALNQFQVNYWNSQTSYNSTPVPAAAGSAYPGLVFIRATYNGTNFVFSLSSDPGETSNSPDFLNVFGTLSATAFATAIDQVGIFVDTETGSPAELRVISWSGI